MKSLSAVALSLFCAAATAQSLPPPSRTVYRCEHEGKVHYSDAPCLGAVKVDVEPTRGLNKATGRELQGADVRNERLNEILADATKPLTGNDARQRAQAIRRQQLSADAQRQCRLLDQQLPDAEAAERIARKGDELAAAQKQLLKLRATYRQLRCE